MKLYDNVAAVLQTGFSQTHNISVEGGSDKVTVRGSASYLEQTGVVKTSEYTRLNIGLSGKAEITKWLSFESNMSYASTTNTKTLKGNGGPLQRAVRWPLTDDMSKVFNEDGLTQRHPDIYTDTDLLNPLYALYKNRNYDESDRMMVNVSLNATPTKNTFVRATMGWDTGLSDYEYFVHPYYGNPTSASYGDGSFHYTKSQWLDKTVNVLAGYNNEWGKFTFNAQVGYHQQENGKWQPTPVFLPGESQGWQSLVGCRLWGHTESDTTEAT